MGLDSDDVDGCLKTVPAGTLVCKGKYWNDVKRAKCCFTPNQQDPKIFHVRYVVGPCLQMENITGDTQLPLVRQIKEQIVRLGAKKVTEESHDAVMVEVARRAVLDYEEGLARGDADGEEDSDMEEDIGDHGGDKVIPESSAAIASASVWIAMGSPSLPLEPLITTERDIINFVVPKSRSLPSFCLMIFGIL
jgi:hypothetical protein